MGGLRSVGLVERDRKPLARRATAEESFDRRLNERDARLFEWLDVMEGAIREMSGDIPALRSEMSEMRDELERRAGRLDDLEKRRVVVEKRLGIR